MLKGVIWLKDDGAGEVVVVPKISRTTSDFVCHVSEDFPEASRKAWRKACADLPLYGEHEGRQYCVLHFPGKNKEAEFKAALKGKLARKNYDFSGAVFPEGTAEFRNSKFSENVSFAGASFHGKANFLAAQFNGEVTDFQQAQFNGMAEFSQVQFRSKSTLFFDAKFGEMTDFSEATFGGTLTTFLRAKFSDRCTTGSTTFRGAKFNSERTEFVVAQFSGLSASFLDAKFSGDWTDFSEATFGRFGANFSDAEFGGKRTKFSKVQFGGKAEFSDAEFGGAESYFQEVRFSKEVNFKGAIFKEKVAFQGATANRVFGPEAWARFDQCRIEKPELLTFNTVSLHPGWFINADVRKVDFTDVKWYGMPGGPEGTLDGEIDALKKRDAESPHTLLAQACRRLSDNAEESHEYPLANEFHYWSMNALRKAGWRHLGLIGTLY